MSKPIVTTLFMTLIVASQATSAFAGGKSASHARTGSATFDHGVAPTHSVTNRTDSAPAHKIATVTKTTDVTLKRGTLASYGFHMTTYHASFPPR